jgi:prephenate dehydratase
VALAQCTRFFARHKHIRPEAAYDTAGAARDVAERGDRVCGAIAARAAADRYGLVVLAADIQDRADNATRFLGIGRARAQRLWTSRGPVRCILLAETANRPGALIELLAPFARRGINLTKLESRPGEEPWTYRFIVELEGTDVGAAVAEAADHVTSLRVLGSFHRAAPTALRGCATGAAFS